MLFCVPDLPVTGQVLFADRRNDVKAGCADNKIEPELIIALSCTAMGNSGCLLFLCDLYHFFCDQGPGERGAHRVTLVGSVCLDRRKDVLLNKPFPHVYRIMAIGKFPAFFRGLLDLLIPLADIDCNRDHAIVVIPFL